MKLIVFSLLMAVPTPPGFLALFFLITFWLTLSMLKELTS